MSAAGRVTDSGVAVRPERLPADSVFAHGPSGSRRGALFAWLTLGVVGQLALLALYGPGGWDHGLLPPARFAGMQYAAIAVILAQLVAAAWACRNDLARVVGAVGT